MIQALPDDMRLWKYGNNAMDSYRSKIDHISDMILKKYFEEDLKDLDKILDNISKQYAAAYGDSRQGSDFKKGKKDDLRYRMGNAILSECRKIERNARMQKSAVREASL